MRTSAAMTAVLPKPSVALQRPPPSVQSATCNHMGANTSSAYFGHHVGFAHVPVWIRTRSGWHVYMQDQEEIEHSATVLVPSHGACHLPDVQLLPAPAARAGDADAFVTDSMHGLAAIVDHIQRGDGSPKFVHLP